ncbi:MAG: GDSL-type esterase/lipase family protein, partial [Verrucomicrobium sp.]
AWQLFHESQVRQARNETMDVVFIGDSLIQGWTTVGRESWSKNFEPLKAACFGIASDTTGNVLWRLDNGLLDFHAPKVVVLMVGASNLWSGRNTSEEIVDGYRAIVEKLRTKVPDAQILVLGVLPVAPALTDLARQRATELNVLAAQLNDWNRVKFANFAPKFIRRDGRLQDEFYQADNMNLTAKGYEAFAKELTPIVMEMLKPIPTTTPAVPEPELGPVGR